ncbi:VWA domain-containing protein [Kibdelosporangium philippinense]|uniref:VWA domain-containing protein n=1 Tax=Kibdelosporangium philippinense TaxID=211113 RepID=A0ABS8ZSG6_9PSEU|nr:vWA domain-containing protein [Kibdelosporangium philippinense]MCE7009925.1 VWA domain-containing protein [Kibdelosporangium philippinense]
MTTHLVADPDATGTAVFPARPEWLTLSAALANEAPMIADREDLLVTIAPGAGGGAPACFYPARALIEVDGTYLGVDPGTVRPADLSDRTRYAPTWGLLTHECGHAAHTRWEPPDGTPPAVVEAALLLEEPRMEAAQARRRPDDRHWLRASALNIAVADLNFTADNPADGPGLTTMDAAQTAALVLGRVDGGILTATETAPLARLLVDILGARILDTLRGLWRQALEVSDDDADTMIDLGRRWCGALGIDPDNPTAAPGGYVDPSAGSALADALDAVLGAVAQAVADETPPTPAVDTDAEQASEDAAREAAEAAARTVFSGGHHRSRTGGTRTTGTRKPNAQERSAARVLARALSTAGVRERVTIKSTSAAPPGRLRMRGALAADAQRAAGAIVTAEPFTRTSRRIAPSPPLRLGIACDVSGSMSHLRGAVASTAWILAHAGHHATIPVETATVIFGEYVRPITYPGNAPDVVTTFAASDDWEDITKATDALDGALRLSRPGAARLLVIVSDGHFAYNQYRDGQKRVNRLRANGCAVLWLTTDPDDNPFDGVTVHQLTDPTNTAQAIGRAATTALQATARR